MDLRWTVIHVEKIMPDEPNPPFRIENFRWEDEMFGHIPSMICRFDIATAEYSVKEYLFMDIFRRFLRQDFPEVADKLVKLREYIGGFGSKHRQMTDILTETGFDFEFYIRHIVQNYLDIRQAYTEQLQWERASYPYEANPRNYTLHDGEDEPNYMTYLKEKSYCWEFFCEELCEAVVRISHQHYPDLLHLPREAYKKWLEQIEDSVTEIGNINADYDE